MPSSSLVPEDPTVLLTIAGMLLPVCGRGNGGILWRPRLCTESRQLACTGQWLQLEYTVLKSCAQTQQICAARDRKVQNMLHDSDAHVRSSFQCHRFV